MTESSAYIMVKALPKEEQEYLLRRLIQDFQVKITSTFKKKNTPLIKDSEAIAYLIKNVFSKK